MLLISQNRLEKIFKIRVNSKVRMKPVFFLTFELKDACPYFFKTIAPQDVKIGLCALNFVPISGRVYRASAFETVDLGSIHGRVKPKTIKIGIHSFPVWLSALKGTVWSLHRVLYTGGQVAAWLDRKVPSLSPCVIIIINPVLKLVTKIVFP